MDNNNIDTTSLLLARGFGGYGSGGYGGNGLSGGYGGMGGYGGIGAGNSMLAADAHANGTATKEAIDCNFKSSAAGLDRISAQAEEVRRDRQIGRVTDAITNGEFRSIDRQRDIERILNQNSKDQASCCCDTQKLILEKACDTDKLVLAQGNETRALINEVESRRVRDELNESRAKIAQLETINALSRGHHNG